MRNCTCEDACYSCLKSYENQHYHDQLDRNAAAEFLAHYDGKTKNIIYLEGEELKEAEKKDD